MKPVCLDLHECNGIGDLICATPTIKVLSQSYGQKITVLSNIPELFKENIYVEASYKYASVDIDYFNEHYIIHNSFYNVGKKNERGIEYKHNKIDIRQFHAINLGFMLAKDEMLCYYRPTEELKLPLPSSKYIVIHPAQNWPSRTWNMDNWQKLANILNGMGYEVVAIGKDSSEKGFFHVQKPVFQIGGNTVIDYTNQTTISDCWWLIKHAFCVITMDSGILHLAGTTNTNIICLGSSINPEFRMPYRNGTQSYRLQYISGKCNAMCASDMQFGVREWGNIQGVPPLIGCLKEKQEFECHPTVEAVCNAVINIEKYNL